jgi:hypothetical protein
MQLAGIWAVKQAGSREKQGGTCSLYVVNGIPGSALIMWKLIEEDKQ